MTSTKSPEDAAAVVDRYRRLLESLQMGPQEIHDETELLDLKTAIADALLHAADPSSDIDVSPRDVQGWLAALAQFQPGVGQPILDTRAEMARRMAAGRADSNKPDLAAIGRDISRAAEEEQWQARRRRFAPQVNLDRTRLLGLL